MRFLQKYQMGTLPNHERPGNSSFLTGLIVFGRVSIGSKQLSSLIWHEKCFYVKPKKGDSPQRTQRKALINIREARRGIVWVKSDG
jgi:hypothetical protein